MDTLFAPNAIQHFITAAIRKVVSTAAKVFGIALVSASWAVAASPMGASTHDASADGRANQMATSTDEAIRPFHVDIPQSAIDDLRQRIQATRWPDKETVDDSTQGAPLAKLQALLAYWGSDYDWRKIETKLNALPQFVTTIDGVDIQFIHVRSRQRNALPVIITHGWPGSIIEHLKIVGPLTDPTAHGGRADEAFDVVIPSMPGYGFSGRPTGTGWDPDHIARAWAELMRRLGYTHYVAQGGDWGSPISLEMARQAPAGLLGIHINLPAAVPPEVSAALATGGPAPASLTDEEHAVYEVLAASAKKGNSSYFAMMTARPQAVGYATTDSPAGLAAWILVHPGFSKWSYGTDPMQSLTKDDVLDDISLYWLTNTAASSARLYWENQGRSPLFTAPWKTNEISLPVAITIFGEDALSAAGKLGEARLSEPHLLPPGRKGRAFRGVGTA